MGPIRATKQIRDGHRGRDKMQLNTGPPSQRQSVVLEPPRDLLDVWQG